MPDEPPQILIVAGPNGAGKTTFATEFLATEAPVVPFINADIIAAELQPEDPESVAVEAGRKMLEEIERRVERRESFCIETTLSGKAWVRRIRQWREAGYFVRLIFLSLKTAGTAKKRVANRVREGGHNIPPEAIERRFDSGLTNFHGIYKGIVDDWMLFDNSDRRTLIARKSHEGDTGKD